MELLMMFIRECRSSESGCNNVSAGRCTPEGDAGRLHTYTECKNTHPVCVWPASPEGAVESFPSRS